MQFTVENVCGLIIRSRLFTPDEVKALYQRWLDEAKESATRLSQFRKWLVAGQYLTDYQATLLFKGHADDFFLGQYRILDRLGKGRMAGVYRAIHHLGQVVAIKVLPPSRAKDPQMLGRFLRETRLAVRLKHPHVVRAFQVGEVNGLHYLVMEYLEGETLDDVLQRRKRLPPNEAVRLIHQALLGLQHIHEQGMIHRDLKPANLMLVPASGRGDVDTTVHSTVKILDIGLGREMFDENAPATEQPTELTGEGVLLGTPDYLAPEQARDPRAIDIRADIYSLGCVLYHLLAGQAPFPDKNILSQMIRHATETAKPLKDFNPAIPDGLQQIVNWMMAKHAEQRYATPERAAQALQVLLVAESEQRADEPPQMKKYLTWLETGGKDEAPVAAAPVAAPAQFPLPPSLPVAAPAFPPPFPRGVPVAAPTRERHRGKRGKYRDVPVAAAAVAGVAAAVAVPAVAVPAVAAPAAVPPPLPDIVTASMANDFDVELVPLNMLNASPRPGGMGLSKRDWIFLGVGAGAVILAGLIGMVIALILRS